MPASSDSGNGHHEDDPESQRACSLVVAAARAAPEVLGSTSVGSELFQDLTALGLSVVGDVSVDSEAPVVTSSISRICWPSLSELLKGVGCACIRS